MQSTFRCSPILSCGADLIHRVIQAQNRGQAGMPQQLADET